MICSTKTIYRRYHLYEVFNSCRQERRNRKQKLPTNKREKWWIFRKYFGTLHGASFSIIAPSTFWANFSWGSLNQIKQNHRLDVLVHMSTMCRFFSSFISHNMSVFFYPVQKSSINPTVGPISLSLQFASSIVVCLIMAPILFSTTGPRFQFTLASAGYLVYALANFLPSWYTLIPSAVVLGFATGISWAGATLFVPTIADDNKISVPLLYSIFTGIVQVWTSMYILMG